MKCLEIETGFICFANVDFKCPHCQKGYSDINDKYLNRLNKLIKKNITYIPMNTAKAAIECFLYCLVINIFISAVFYL